jgi:hypothetical protein
LLVESTQTNKTIPYHEKVIKSFHKLMESIHPKFLETNPILSGSAAISLVYAPNCSYNDLDLYFNKESDLQSALALINTVVPSTKDNTHTVHEDEEDFNKFFTYWITHNAISISLPGQKIQLIKKQYLPPQDIIYKHDFSNVSLAITKDAIFTTKETLYAWYEKKLAIRNFQLPENASLLEELTFYLSFLTRVDKYLQRYSLTLHENLYAKLLEIQTIIKDPHAFLPSSYLTQQVDMKDLSVFVNSVYYGNQQNKVTYKDAIYKAKDLITTILFKQRMTREDLNLQNENLLF